MTQPTPTHELEADGAEPSDTSRRGLLRAAVLGGAGAAVGVIALGSKEAAAADDDPLLLGSSAAAGANNTSQTPTTLVYDGTELTEGPSVLSVSDAVPAADAPFPANVGGYGNALVINGVHGSTSETDGHGVVAANLAGASAAGTPAPAAALAVASLHGSQIQFVELPGAVSGPTAGTHVPGELYVDGDGTLWFSVATAPGATTVRWVKLAGTSTAGAFHAINPARSYDSRKTSYTVNGPLAPNQSREISVADDHHRDTGAVTTANVIPAGATAVMVNITVSSPTNKNYIAVTAGNVTTTATSLQNWDAGVTQIANSVTIPLSPTRTIRVYMGDQAGSADIIVDVFGYHM
jgi:hypothetical protein